MHYLRNKKAADIVRKSAEMRPIKSNKENGI